jgi:hypothetical protein
LESPNGGSTGCAGPRSDGVRGEGSRLWMGAAISAPPGPGSRLWMGAAIFVLCRGL